MKRHRLTFFPLEKHRVNRDGPEEPTEQTTATGRELKSRGLNYSNGLTV